MPSQLLTSEQVRHNPNFKVVWQPDALPDEEPLYGKQYEFLTANEDVVLMEGGKGSGKSDLLIWDAIGRPEKLAHPRWHGVIFRREYKRLTEIIDRAQYWIKQLPQLGATWNGMESRFTFPSGAWLGFHNAEHVGDEKKYQGWEITDLKFDQAEEFEERQFDFLVLQNRSGSKDLRTTIRMTANPLGVGHQWIYKRYIKNRTPSESHVVTTDYEGVKYTHTFRRIHSTVFDNPVLKNDKRYIAKLAQHPDPIIRKAMFKGEWDVVLGQFFNFVSDVHQIPSRALPSHWNRVAGLDYGNTKSIEFLCRDYDQNVFVEYEYHSEPNDFQPGGEVAGQFAENSAKFMLDRGIGSGLVIIGDVNMWSATGRDVGSAKTPAKIVSDIWKKRFAEKELKPPKLIGISKMSTEEYRFRVACNQATKDGLYYEMNEEGKITKQPKLFFFDRCGSIAETLPQLIANESDPMDIKDSDIDHDYDAFKGAYMKIKGTKRPMKEITAEDKWNEQVREVEAVQTEDWRTDW